MPFQRASHKNSVKNTCTYSTEVGQQSSKKNKIAYTEKRKTNQGRRTEAWVIYTARLTLHVDKR